MACSNNCTLISESEVYKQEDDFLVYTDVSSKEYGFLKCMVLMY